MEARLAWHPRRRARDSMMDSLERESSPEYKLQCFGEESWKRDFCDCTVASGYLSLHLLGLPSIT